MTQEKPATHMRGPQNAAPLQAEHLNFVYAKSSPPASLWLDILRNHIE